MGALTASGQTRWSRAVEIAESLLREGGAGSEFLVTDTAGQLASVGFTTRREALADLAALRVSAHEMARFPSGDPSLFLDETTEVFFVTDGLPSATTANFQSEDGCRPIGASTVPLVGSGWPWASVRSSSV